MLRHLIFPALLLTAALPGSAAQVYYASWTAADSSTVSGTITLADSSTIGVSYSGDVAFAQINDIGTNYWNPEAPYLSAGVSNSPIASPDIIAISAGDVTNTVTFDAPVLNPIFDIVSLNGATEVFDSSFNVLSYGCGYWGCGTLTANPGPTAGTFELMPTGEGHGAIQFDGSYSSISFYHSAPEYWTGFTVGVEGAGTSATPEPASFALIGLGLGAVTIARKKLRKL